MDPYLPLAVVGVGLINAYAYAHSVEMLRGVRIVSVLALLISASPPLLGDFDTAASALSAGDFSAAILPLFALGSVILSSILITVRNGLAAKDKAQ